MSKLSPTAMEKLIKKGRLVPVINQDQKGNYYLVGYTRKKNSRKNDKIMLPEPELINVPKEKNK